MSVRKLRSSKKESGAVAVIVAIVAIVLFAGAAIGVDLGNAVARKRGVQGQADFSALAAGAHLPGTSMDEYDPAVKAVAEYLLVNAQQQDDSSDLFLNLVNQYDDDPIGTVSALAAQLIDADGDGMYPLGRVDFVTPNRLRVTSPDVRVNFGFAAALGFSTVDVVAEAEVEIGSPSKALPFYVSQDCSYLQQTILNDPNEDLDPPTPVLDPTSDASWEVGLESISPGSTDVGVTLSDLVLRASGHSSLDGVTKIGFTTGADPETASNHVEVTAFDAPPTVDGGDSIIQFDLPPDSVEDLEALWYVRVFKGGKWSKDHVTFKVGSPPLYCAGQESGNFGALRLSRNDVTMDGFWPAVNTIRGVMHELAVFPRSPAPFPCESDAQASMGDDPNDPIPADFPVNCLKTQNGSLEQAEQGFLTGIRDVPLGIDEAGLLDTGSSICNVDGNSDPRVESVQGHGSVQLNDDVLTCFFKAGEEGTTIRQVAAKTGAKEDVISSRIFESPRFFWMPVINYDPTHGHSYSYPLIEFRAAFLTGQPLDASPSNPMRDATIAAENGLKLEANPSGAITGLGSIDVVMINEASLPNTADIPGDIISYIGTGTKIVRLVD